MPLSYTVTVTNYGPTSASGVTVTDTLPIGLSFVSATPSQGSCTGGVTVTCALGALANGGSATITLVVTPTQVATVTHTVSVTGLGIDPNLTNNTATAQTSVINDGPDLVPTIFTAATSGSSLVLNNQITNQGTTAAGLFYIGYYLSADSVFDGTDAFVGQEYLSSLAAGASSPPTGTWSSNYTIPSLSVVPTGMYYAIVRADLGDAITESNETNNTLATAAPLGIGPDLTPTAISAVRSGTTKVLVSETVKNQGNRDAGGFTIRYYLSTDATYQAGTDLALATKANGTTPCNRTRSAQNVNTTSSVSSKACYKPAGAQNGVNYYVLVVDDVLGQVTEYDESNNTRATGGTISW